MKKNENQLGIGSQQYEVVQNDDLLKAVEKWLTNKHGENTVLASNCEGIKTVIGFILAVVRSMLQAIVKTVIVFAPVGTLFVVLAYAMGDVTFGIVVAGLACCVMATSWGLWTLISESEALSLEDFLEDLKGSIGIVKATVGRMAATVWVMIVPMVIVAVIGHSIVLALLMTACVHITGCLAGSLLSQFMTGEPDVPFDEI